MHATPTYLEIGSDDPTATSAFFAAVFGWTYTPMGAQGGFFQTPTLKAGLHGDDPAPQISVYFSVPDLAQAVATVRAAGGVADDPGPEEPGFGRFSTCQAPGGVRFGLHQPPG
jgi:uncharacterized protein